MNNFNKKYFKEKYGIIKIKIKDFLIIHRLSKLSTKEKIFFIKKLSVLHKAGMPLLDSLQAIYTETQKPNYTYILEILITDISRGQFLSKSLHKFKRTFGEFTINVIAHGESTGNLAENLEYLSGELKKRNNLKKKILSAMIYQALITLTTFIITGFLMIYLFPKITPILKSLHIHLPLSTRLVIAFSAFITKYFRSTALGILFIFIITPILIKKYKRLNFYIDLIMIKIPILKTLVIDYNLSNQTRTLALLLKSGLTLGESLDIAARTTPNLVFQKELKNMLFTITRGEKISKYLNQNNKIFPEITAQIVSIGERSGNLPETFLYLSEHYEANLEELTKNLSVLLEPILMIIMGAIVGLIAISIITPIYSITQNLNPH